MNHLIRLHTSNNKVEHLSLSLDPKYSKYIEINFLKQICFIHCMKDGQPHTISIPKIIEPDFPHLTKLKERVSLYVVFS